MIVVDLEPHDPRLVQDVLPVLRELRPHLTPASFAAVYDEGYGQGLRYVAAYDDDRCVGVAGWRILATTNVISKLYVDDLVITAGHRHQGVGAVLLAELSERASAAGCRVLDLDSGLRRADAHRFYMREGMVITSFHFTRRVGRDAGEPPSPGAPSQPPP
jgi:GNAT superfamily N-acetyltransferase